MGVSVTRWKRKVASFLGTWPMWVVIIIIGSTLLGIAGGWRRPTQDENHRAKATTETSIAHTELVGNPAPHSALRTDVSPEERREIFNPPDSNAGPVFGCPDADSVTSTLTTTVSSDNYLVIASSLHVSASGVTPPHPPLDLNRLLRPEGATNFASCFIATDADLKSLNWADGKLEADLDLQWHDNPHEAIGYINEPVRAALNGNHSTLTVNECEPHPEWANGLRTICHGNAKNTVVIRVAPPIMNVMSMPFPSSQADKDEYFDSTWQFEGPPPTLTVMLAAPFSAVAGSWLYWNRGRTFAIPGVGLGSIDYYYLVDAGAIWLALLATAFLLRRRYTEQKAPSYSRSLFLIVLAGVVLGLEIRTLGVLGNLYANGVIVVISWAILAVAVMRQRAFRVIAGLSIVTLIPLVVLATPVSLSNLAVNLLLLGFSLALVSLVITAAWLLWRQIATLLSLANLDDGTSIWLQRYRRAIDVLVIATFMFGIGYPVGETLNAGPGISWLIGHLASDLIWSTGLIFRAPLAWVSLLVAISYLARRLTSHHVGAIEPPRHQRWTRIRWIRVCNGKVAALLAMILCLSAPWTSRFALGFVPVWVLQFGILWLAFIMLSGTRPRRLSRVSSRRATQLLHAAIGATPEDDASTSSDGPAVTRAAETAVTRDPSSGSRLLTLGSQPGRVANAKAAAQIASVIAMVPVIFLIWTTLTKFSDRLSSNTGILLVALLAVLEFARWVVSGFIFGYLYAKLPSRIGPVKALSFAAIWALSCVGPLVCAQIAGNNLIQETIYRGAQFALFSIILAVGVDLKAVKSAGGTWRDLRNVYDLQSYGEVAAAITPAALLALTLAQQIIAGSSLQVASSLLSGIGNVLKGPV